jgi:uncharacterized repeat protein (TIGR01451 family)
MLSGSIPDEGCGFGVIAFPATGLENGPDGIALLDVASQKVVQFVSYEGVFIATSGPASGFTPAMIPVSESPSMATGKSLQLIGSGYRAADFAWTGPANVSPGSLNTGQIIAPCRGVTLISYSDTVRPGPCPNGRLINRMWTARRPMGESTSAVQTITVADHTAPVLNTPPDVAVQCGQSTHPSQTGRATATDNCDLADRINRLWINEFHYDNAGSDTNEFIEIAGVAGIDLSRYRLVLYDGSTGHPYYTMNLSGAIPDQASGYGAVAFTIPVPPSIENGAPDGVALVAGSDLKIIQFSSYEGTFTALTGPAAGMTAVDVGIWESNSTPLGYSLQLTGAGNQADDFTWTGPTPSSPGALNMDAGQAVASVAITYTDSISPGICPHESTIKRTWTATDRCGNSSESTQLITVRDMAGPIVTAATDKTVESDGAGNTADFIAWITNYGGASAADACHDAVAWTNNAAIATWVPDCGNSRHILIIFTATDTCGNAATTAATFTVADTTPPKVSCPIEITAITGPDCLARIPDLSIQGTANDNSGGPVTLTQNPPAGTPVGVGVHTIILTATDGCDNSSTWTGTLTVIDDQKPTITPPLPLSINADPGCCYAGNVELGTPVTADNCGVATVTNNAPSRFPVGQTIVRWTAADLYGNTATADQLVTVIDREPPTIFGCPDKDVLLLDADCQAFMPDFKTRLEACDNCTETGALVVSQRPPPGTPLGPGQFPVTLAVSDTAGNTATCTETVTVAGGQLPLLVLGDICVIEGDNGLTAVKVTAELSHPSCVPVTTAFTTADETAIAGSDYRTSTGTLAFKPGEISAAIELQIIADTLDEPDEIFMVRLFNLTNAIPSGSQATVLIANDDPQPELNVADVRAEEGNEPTTDFPFVVTLSSRSGQPVTVSYFTVDGTASAGRDYVALGAGLADAESIGSLVAQTGTAPATDFTPGRLQIGQNGPTVILSWFSLGDDLALQAKDSLSATMSWRIVTDTVMTAGQEHRVTQPIAGSSKFYQLAKRALPGLKFSPGETNKPITVVVRGNTVKEPDKTFFVQLVNPLNARIGRGRALGVILNDDMANEPPDVHIRSPANSSAFIVGTDIQIEAAAGDRDGAIRQVDFYAGTVPLGKATTPPYRVTWKGASLGDHILTAVATDDEGATTRSAPVTIAVISVSGDVAIVQNFSHPEIDALQDYLSEMGLTARVFDQEGLTLTALRTFKLVIWDDLGDRAQGLTDAEVSLFAQAYANGIPLYLIGETLASSTANLNESIKAQWVSLTRLELAVAKAGNGFVTIPPHLFHPVIRGPFGAVLDFAYPALLDSTSVTDDGADVLAQSGEVDALVATPPASEPDAGATRTVTQNFLVTAGLDEFSLQERKRLFQNAVCWLTVCQQCNLAEMRVALSASPKTANVSAELTYTVTVAHSGECRATGVLVMDTIPPGVSFVRAETDWGTWSYADGVVQFKLGKFPESSAVELKVVVVPTQAGTITNMATVNANEGDPVPWNNTTTLETEVLP